MAGAALVLATSFATSLSLAQAQPAATAPATAPAAAPDGSVEKPAERPTVQRFRFGLLFGAHFADFGGTERQLILEELPDYSFETRERLALGGFLAIALTESWGLRVEGLFATKGGRATDAIPFMAADPRCAGTPELCPEQLFAAQYSLDHVLRYIEVPILVEYHIPYDGAIRPHLFAGPALRFLYDTDLDIEGDIVDGAGMATADLNATGDLEDVSEGFDLAAVIGAGVELPLRWGSLVLAIRYELGLLSAVDGDIRLLTDIEGEPSLPVTFVPVEADRIRNRGFSLLAGYTF